MNSLVFDLLGTRIYAGSSSGQLREFAVDGAAIKAAAKEATAPLTDQQPDYSAVLPPATLPAAAPAGATGGAPSQSGAAQPAVAASRRPSEQALRALRSCDDFQV